VKPNFARHGISLLLGTLILLGAFVSKKLQEGIRNRYGSEIDVYLKKKQKAVFVHCVATNHMPSIKVVPLGIGTALTHGHQVF